MSPAVAVARKRAVVSELCDAMGAHKLIRNFLFVAVDHGRIATVSADRAAFEAAVDERLGRVRAEVASAAPLQPRGRRIFAHGTGPNDGQAGAL